jgi:hypothetical protein
MGFFKLIQKSTNQYSANIISLGTTIPKRQSTRQSNHKPCGKANTKQGTKQGNNRSIDKPDNQITNKPINIYRFRSLTITVEEFEK